MAVPVLPGGEQKPGNPTRDCTGPRLRDENILSNTVKHGDLWTKVATVFLLRTPRRPYLFLLEIASNFRLRSGRVIISSSNRPQKSEARDAPPFAILAPEKTVCLTAIGNRHLFSVPLQWSIRCPDGHCSQKDGLCHWTGLLKVGLILGCPVNGITEVVIMVSRLKYGSLDALEFLRREQGCLLYTSDAADE